MKSIEERFANIRTYSEGGQRSLHKPLLLLFALGYCYLGRERMISFSVIDEALIRLFDKFYPAASERANTHYPFGRLEFDGIWELEQSATLSRTSVGHLFKSELLEKHIHAGLSLEIHEALSSDKNRLTNIASQLLHRPPT
jgi:predicted restriction endonuclease